ncbi:sensor signal transduction histidine kinase [Gottschalkia acidurici 9a]|uniref:histidine kinase n=1 Tax=Gottschalkia acidurici (strain ATCC 7906 / DSM 604 / BCRC 14475 / CIP 104303 / KCTC 5404 / NCIMB 10678 / 9a) TaxID=1128398 RepID=K0B3F0_GOTA9|nr:HAMP domain-containing sensor histidine kinase [Gottschalkia acidurici]AFS79702.1 sensor signal transduction histidine kinase [Gottschalkia acidurici 9a]
MENLIIIFLIGALAIFVAFYFLQQREIKSISNQLEKINESRTNSKLLISMPNKELEKLALEINKFLEKKQKIEAKYKKMDLELRQAIVNISHDLRTPLTSIKGYIQLIEDSTLSSDEKSQYISIVKKRTESLEVLISNFYELSRLEANEYKFSLKSINISNMLCDVMAAFYNEFQDKGIDPAIKIDEKVPSIIGDENAVRRVIANLIQNMIKYGDKIIDISLEQHKDVIIMDFTNDTVGLINKEDVSHIFDRSFTVDRTRSGQSTGIGLAITKQLVEQMGHKIYVELIDNKISIKIEWRYL